MTVENMQMEFISRFELMEKNKKFSRALELSEKVSIQHSNNLWKFQIWESIEYYRKFSESF
jgi:hypothetical protein